MKKLQALFVLMLIMLCVFSMGKPSEAVQIKGKALGQIKDIVKEATGSEFGEIQKHSLLFTERMVEGSPTGYDTYILSHVFTINNDGTLAKEYVMPQIKLNEVYSDYTFGSEYFLQNMRPAISDKRFGTRRTVAYVSSGNSDSVIAVPAQTFSFTKDNDTVNVTAQDVQNQDIERVNPVVWGSAAMTFKGIDKDVFVYLHSPQLANTGTLTLNFIATDRNESGSISLTNIYRQNVLSYSDGIRGANIAAGDFDNDGYKDEVALCFNDNGNVRLYVYKVSYSKNGDSLRITGINQTYTYLIHTGGGYDHYCDRQACVNVIAGDFDGDGQEEIATVNRVFPNSSDNNGIRINIFKYNTSSKSWSADSEALHDGAEGACRAARADFDGDGKDELVILFFAERSGAYYPRLERWYCDQGSIKPKRDTRTKGGRGDTSVLGVWFGGNYLNEYYYFTETMSITAGPLTGRMGKAKLADDVAISWTDTDRRIFIVPTQLDSDRNFSGFGDSVKIYEQHVPSYVTRSRGAVLTSDFANEVLLLGEPTHTVDDHDTSFVSVLQAVPYHVDNVGTDGELKDYPINYTFSGFEGDEGNGKMSVTYKKSSSSSQNNDVSFNMASTTETISLLGDAGKYVHGYLKFRTTEANIAGNFDERAKPAAAAMNKLMDLVTDRIDETTTNATQETKQRISTSTMKALLNDYVLMYYAPQHIWRYKILNDPLPSWYQFGPKADYSEGNLKPESKTHYLTFSIYDDASKVNAPSTQNSYYQPRHEEGNFFSYPSAIEDSEGYNASGLLSNPLNVMWSKGIQTGETIHFSQSKIDSQKYEDKIEKSFLTKTISAIATFFGAEDPDPLPKYTSHSETFTKSLSTSEEIDVEVYGRSTIPGEDAEHMLSVVPFIAREGTMTVGTAVKLTEDSTLWSEGSRYQKYPDPALVLPRKYKRNGATLVQETNNRSAMKLRGLRFYVPEIDLDSDNNFLAGLTYKIRVPVYNASFRDTGTFKVKLSYGTGSFNALAANTAALTEIDSTDISLGGWSNVTSRNNHGWAEFTWTVPEDMKTTDCYFFVQIDPDNALEEVHESRLNPDGTMRDMGGNNEGYFEFVVTSVEGAIAKQDAKQSGVSSASAGIKDGVLYRSVYRKGSGEKDAINSANVRSAFQAEDSSGKVKVNVRLEGYEEIEVVYLLGLLAEMAEVSMDTMFPLECQIEYNGDEYYPEVLLTGVNYAPEAFERISEDIGRLSELTHNDVTDAFAIQKISLIPHQTVSFMIDISPRNIDWRSGVGFEIIVPELIAPAADNGDDVPDDNTPDDNVPDDNTPDDNTPDDNASVRKPASGGGCDSLTGSMMLLCLAGLAFTQIKRQK